jgi:hypothetical protein
MKDILVEHIDSIFTVGLPTCFHVSILFGLFDLKMEVKRSSETSVEFERTKRLYIPEDSTLDECIPYLDTLLL